MDKLPVGQLPDLASSNNDDEIMIITDSEHNQLKKEKISDFITDLTSTDEGNVIEKGTDGKLFTSGIVNASNIKGVLGLDNIPQLTTEKLPESGVTAGYYRNPVNLNVNAKGQITAVEDGESGIINDITPLITNCILTSSDPSIQAQNYTGVSFINHGTTDTSGVLSNFSTTNFAILAKTMPVTSEYVFTLPFTTGASLSGVQPLFAVNNKDNCIVLDNGTAAVFYNGNEIKGSAVLSAATAYSCVLTKTATNYTIEIKQNEVTVDTINLPSSVNFFGGKTIFLGFDQSGRYFEGSIDLSTASITSEGSAYWAYTDEINCTIITVSGSFQLLMPNGRNETTNQLINVSETITLDNLILYNANGANKTLLVTNEGELMARDNYTESYNEPSALPVNGVWFDKTENKLKEQLSIYPNLINSGVTISEAGIASGFSAANYIGLPSTVNLAGNFSLNLNLKFDTTQSNCSVVSSDNGLKNIELTQNLTTITAKFRRDDVYVVNNYITTGEGESTEAQTVTGYVKLKGAGIVPADTTVYADADCTSVQATASGTDYTYSGETAKSVICTLTDTVTGGSFEAVTMGYNGTNYYLNSNTYTSSDLVQGFSSIQLGSNGTDYFTNGEINLSSGTNLTPANGDAWQWNGVIDNVSDYIEFVGAKIGRVTVNTEITHPNINIEGALTNNNGVFSGFNSTNTLNIPAKFQPDNTPWEMLFKITTGSDISTSQRIALISSGFGIHLGVMSSKFRLWLSTNGSSWDLANDTTGTYTVLANTEYYVQVKYTGSAYTVSYSLTGEPDSFTQDISVTSSTPLNFSNGYTNIGGSTIPWLGSIDLNKSYININGEQWWKWNGLLESKSTYSIGSIELNFPLEIAKQTDLTALKDYVYPIGKPVYTLSDILEDGEIWLEGATVSRTTYAALFEIYGTTYGEGDGSTTFNLPDFRNRTLWGAEDFGYIEAGLPNITGSLNGPAGINWTGALYATGTVRLAGGASTLIREGWTYLNASPSNSIYGNSTTVQPPSVKVRVKTRFA